MESIVIEDFMREVFEKARKECGSEVRDAVVKHIERSIFDIKENEDWKFKAISCKTLERYHKKYVEKWDDSSNDGFKVPDGDFRFQLSRYLGYSSYMEYLSKYQQNESTKTEIFIAKSITKTDTMNGDIIMQ